jgi:hypothetical protein
MSLVPAAATVSGVLEPLPADVAHRILTSLPLVERACCECVSRAWCAALRAAAPAALNARAALGALRAAGVPLRPAAARLGGGSADEDEAAARVVASLARRSGRALRALTLFGDAQLRAVAPALSAAPPPLARLTLINVSLPVVSALLSALRPPPAFLLVERCAVEAHHLAPAFDADDEDDEEEHDSRGALVRLLSLPVRSGALRLSLSPSVFRNDDNAGDEDDDPLEDPRVARLARLGALLPRCAAWRRVRVRVSAAAVATLQDEFSGDGASLATLFEAFVSAFAASASSVPPQQLRCVLDLRGLQALAVRDGARIVRDAPPHHHGLRIIFGALSCPPRHAGTLSTALPPSGSVLGVVLMLEAATPPDALATALAALRACAAATIAAAAAAADDIDEEEVESSHFELSLEGGWDDALPAACIPPLAALLSDDALSALRAQTCFSADVAVDVVAALLPPLCASRRLRAVQLGGASITADVVKALATALGAGQLHALRELSLHHSHNSGTTPLSLDATAALGAALVARAAPLKVSFSLGGARGAHLLLLAPLVLDAHVASTVPLWAAEMMHILTHRRGLEQEEAHACLRALAPALMPALLRILLHHVSSGGCELEDANDYDDYADAEGAQRWWPLTAEEEARGGVHGAEPVSMATVLALLAQLHDAAPQLAARAVVSAAPMCALAALARRAASYPSCNAAAPARALAARRDVMPHLRAGLLAWARRGAPRDASTAVLCEIAAACRRSGAMPTLLASGDDDDEDEDEDEDEDADAAAEARSATMALLLACGLAGDAADAALDTSRHALAAHATCVFRAVAARAARVAERMQQQPDDAPAAALLLRALCEAAHYLEAAARVLPLRHAFLADVNATATSADADAAANVLRALITAPWLHVVVSGSSVGGVDEAHAVRAAAAAYKALALLLCMLPGGGSEALRSGWGAAPRLRHDAPARAPGVVAITRWADMRCGLGVAAGRLRGVRARATAAAAAMENAEDAADAAATARVAERGAASVELLLRLV